MQRQGKFSGLPKINLMPKVSNHC